MISGAMCSILSGWCPNASHSGMVSQPKPTPASPNRPRNSETPRRSESGAVEFRTCRRTDANLYPSIGACDALKLR
jgi:hypothetical protein